MTENELCNIWNSRVLNKYEFNRVFCKNSRLVGREKIKKFLLANWFEYKCSNSLCGLEKWHNTFISLELDHINGDRYDNTLNNLRLLCPNCHSQTVTYSGKNVSSPTIDKCTESIIIDMLNKTPNIRQTLISLGLQAFGGNYDRVRNIKKQYNIIQSNKSISTKRPSIESFLSAVCVCNSREDLSKYYNVTPHTITTWMKLYNINNKYIGIGTLPNSESMIINASKMQNVSKMHCDVYKSNRVTKEELLTQLSTKSILAISKLYNVSDNAVRKWMRKYDIPINRLELKDYLKINGYEVNIKMKSPITHIKGSSVASSKLTEDSVNEIRELYTTGNYSMRYLGNRFGVVHSTIKNLISRKTWNY